MMSHRFTGPDGSQLNEILAVNIFVDQNWMKWTKKSFLNNLSRLNTRSRLQACFSQEFMLSRGYVLLCENHSFQMIILLLRSSTWIQPTELEYVNSLKLLGSDKFTTSRSLESFPLRIIYYQNRFYDLTSAQNSFPYSITVFSWSIAFQRNRG